MAPSTQDVFNAQSLDVTKKLQGTLVEQRASSPEPDVLNYCDTLYLDITVRGEGSGGYDAGLARKNSYARAMQIYRSLQLILDRVINGTHYIRISPDSAPVEIPVQDGYAFRFGLEAVRHIGDGITWQTG